MYLVPFRSDRSLLFKFWTLCIVEPPFGGLGTTYSVHLGLIGKCIVDFLLVLIELFLLGVTAESIENWRFCSNAVALTQQFIYKGSPPPIIFAKIVRPMNALQLCC